MEGQISDRFIRPERREGQEGLFEAEGQLGAGEQSVSAVHSEAEGEGYKTVIPEAVIGPSSKKESGEGDETLRSLGAMVKDAKELLDAPKRFSPIRADGSTASHKFYFLPVRIGKGGESKVVRFTRRELMVMEAFLATGHPKAVAEATGVPLRTVYRVLKRAATKSVLTQRISDQSIVNQYNGTALKAKVLKAAMGEEKVGREQMEAMKLSANWFPETSEMGGGNEDTMEIEVKMKRRVVSGTVSPA